MQHRPALRGARRRLAASAGIAGALILPLGGALAFADTPDPGGLTPTTPEATTPVATTPTPTTPAATTPVATTPSIAGAATTAQIGWSAPDGITEERAFTLKFAGAINGQATAHIAVTDPGTACPASPLYPQQIATGVRVGVTTNPAATPVFATSPSTPTTTPAVLAATTSGSLSYTPKDSGSYRLCGWLVGAPASSADSTVARFDQVIGVANRPATLNADIPDVARSADYFTIKLTGTTAAAGRRVLIMGEPDHGQRCDQMRKLPTGKRPLQSVVAVASGDFSKTVKVRFASKTAGAELVCAQIVETVDRSPEAFASRTMTISETLKCTTVQTAIAQTVKDLGTIRGRRDAALARLKAAKKRAAPLRARVARQKTSSNKKIATARKALRRAKSAAGRKKASRHLAAVRKSEASKVYKAGAGLRALSATMRGHQRSYSQYRTGANLLNDTLTRTRKDLKKYCSPTGR